MLVTLKGQEKKNKQRNWNSNYEIILAFTIELHYLHNHHNILVFPFCDYRFETPEAKGNALQLANTLKQELFGQ